MSRSGKLCKVSTRGRMMKWFRWVWAVVTMAVLANGFRVAMYVVPADRDQGDLSRILYYHVPTWCGMAIFFAINLLCSIVYLVVRQSNRSLALRADALAVSSAEMGVVYCLIGMATGSIWGKAAWGIWWTWDARLTTTLILWLIYIAYLLLRRFASGPEMRTLAAVLAIFGYADIPIVYMTTRWFRTQHPAPVFFGGPNTGLDPSMLPALFWNMAGWIMWGCLIVSLRYAAEIRAQRGAESAAVAALEAA
nr:cytochrome c biogenesis protein CcsA [Silvibacterium dinghuense]